MKLNSTAHKRWKFPRNRQGIITAYMGVFHVGQW